MSKEEYIKRARLLLNVLFDVGSPLLYTDEDILENGRYQNLSPWEFVVQEQENFKYEVCYDQLKKKM